MFPLLGECRTGTERQDADELGGKGASLDWLKRAGLPVPPGFVVPASVARAADEPRLRDHLRRLGAAMDGPLPPTPEMLLEDYPELEEAADSLREGLDGSLAAWSRPLPR